MIIRTHGNAERDNITVGDNHGHFLDVHFHIEMVNAEDLDEDEKIVQAALDNRILNGRTRVSDDSDRYHAMLEFPIKTMNVNDINNTYQTDTGPILLPNFTSAKERMVERFQLAFVAYNRQDETYFVIQEPTPIVAGSKEKVSHYSKVVRVDAQNSVLAL